MIHVFFRRIGIIVRLRQPDLRSLQVSLRLLVRRSNLQIFQQLANILLRIEKLNIGYKCLSFKLHKMLEQKVIDYSMHIEIKL